MTPEIIAQLDEMDYLWGPYYDRLELPLDDPEQPERCHHCDGKRVLRCRVCGGSGVIVRAAQ